MRMSFSPAMAGALWSELKTETRRVSPRPLPDGALISVLEPYAVHVRYDMARKKPSDCTPPVWYTDGTMAGGEVMNGVQVHTPSSQGDWRPARYMPTRFSRMTLRVTGFRREKLHEIDEDGSMREGIVAAGTGGLFQPWSGEDRRLNVRGPFGPVACADLAGDSRREAFRNLWDTLHARDAEGRWAANPYVSVIAFEVLRQNIALVKGGGHGGE
jgi:hypothetical protein